MKRYSKLSWVMMVFALVALMLATSGSPEETEHPGYLGR